MEEDEDEWDEDYRRKPEKRRIYIGEVRTSRELEKKVGNMAGHVVVEMRPDGSVRIFFEED